MLFGKQMTPMILTQGIWGCHRIQIKNNINDQNFLKKHAATIAAKLRNYRTIKNNT